MQIPLGMASDRYGRRPIIVFGMVLFIAGGVICALAKNVDWIIAGRVIQGLGAVSAAITAWVADATRPEVRTRAMAMVGGSIGISFAVSLVLSPMLVGGFACPGLGSEEHPSELRHYCALVLPSSVGKKKHTSHKKN